MEGCRGGMKFMTWPLLCLGAALVAYSPSALSLELRGTASLRAAFAPCPQPMRAAAGSRGYGLSSLSMSGKKGGKGGNKGKKSVTPPADSSAGVAPRGFSPAPVAAASKAPVAAPKRAAAVVKDDGPEDKDVFARAVAALDAGRDQIGEGVGIGPGPPVSFQGENGKTYTMGESERKGVSGNAFVVRATSKTVTIRLEGKFWGSRQWAFDAVSQYLMEKMPGIQVGIEDEEQLMDLWLKDAWYGEEAWALRETGPQYVNERGIQIGNPYYPDGKFQELMSSDGEGINVNALQLGIEEMMKDALQQSQGSTFTDSTPIRNLDKALATSQTAAFSEGSSESDDNIESVTKVSLSDLAASAGSKGPMTSEVDKALQSNPMFSKMADMLENEPGAMKDIQEMLEKSNGNMFAIMANPKFQQMAQKMMQNPELMQMMSDPNAVKQAMKSAESLGISQEMGIKMPTGMSPSQAAKDLTDKTVGAISSGLQGGDFGSEKPAWLAEVEENVKSKTDRAMMDSVRMKKEIEEAQREMKQQKEYVPVRMDVDDKDDESSFNIMRIMEVSEEESKGTETLPRQAASGGLTSSQKEDLLYLAGGIFGVGAIVFFLGTQLGVYDVPFMQDLGVVSTPAARRGGQQAAPADTDKAKDQAEAPGKKAPAPPASKEDDTPF